MKTRNRFAAIVVHVPHASKVVPPDVREDFVLSDEELELELLRVTDHYTDELFAVEDDRVEVVRYPVSRLVSDPERFREDSEESLAETGLGAVYRKTSHLVPLRRSECKVDRSCVLERYYDPHHERFRQAVERGFQRGPVLIIDGHSFPREPLPFEQDKTGAREQICLGTDSFHTPERLVRCIREHFENLGYSVSTDTPFRGSIVPISHYQRSKEVCSIMIELRRDIYMTEATGRKLPGFGSVQADVAQVILDQLERSES